MRETLVRVRYVLFPAGSGREKIYHLFWVAYSMWRSYGLNEVVRQVRLALDFSRQRGLFSHMSYNYQDWINDHEPDARELARQGQRAEEYHKGPVISFVTPVYDPEVIVLRDTLDSVSAQTYPRWEFCLANASTNPEVANLLDARAQQDGRIHVVHLPENLGISGNSNRALELASGEFIALLDHDDLVSPDTLYEVVQCLQENPELDIVYFDEDKISENAQTRLAPWFKPARWSPDLLLSTNYLMHSVVRRSLVVDLGGFDPAVDGAQDWDLALRLTERTRRMQHIPRVFYHWRQVKGSAARDANAKPWAYAAQERCIKAHLQRIGVTSDVQVSLPRLGTVRIIWPSHQAKVSIIIPTKNNLKLLQACLDSLFEKTTYSCYEILLVDNQSDDPQVAAYYQQIQGDPRVRLLSYPHAYNFHKINNWAAGQSSADVLVFLNNDTEVIEPTWLEELVGLAMRPETAVVGPKLLRPNGRIQHAGMIVGLMGHASNIFEDSNDHAYTLFGSTDWYRNCMSVTGACMATRREVFEQLGGFDEAYIVGYGDIDYCLRAVEAGYHVVYTPFAVLLHHEGGTRGFSLPPSDVLRASVKMYDLVQRGDGFFNPNLSYASRLPAVAGPHEEDRGSRLVRIMREFGLIGTGMDIPSLNEPPLTASENLLAVKPSGQKERQKELSRILMVSHELTRSGAPIILWMLARYFKERGYQLKVICPVDGPLKRDYADEQIPISVVPRLLEDARVAMPYLENADVVLCNTILTWRVVVAARAFARPCLWWVHETDFGVNLLSKQPEIARAFEAATRTVLPSEATKGRYTDYWHKGDFRALFYGFNVEVAPGASDRILEKNVDELHIVCVATIERRKGQDILLDAMAALPEDIAPKIQCHLIGRTRIDILYLAKIAWRSLWMKNVHLVGEMSNAQVLRFLQQADVFAIASRDEALPLALIEAMALGKPIVSTNSGGIAEVIRSGENGYVVEIGDSKAFAECIVRLYHDTDLRIRLGNRAREDYRTSHTISHFGEKMLQFCQEILDGQVVTA